MKCSACKDRPKFWKGSDPKCAFAHGAWSEDNWNCATVGLVRRLFDDEHDGIVQHWANDQYTAMICTQGVGIVDRPLSLWVTWYKSRGRTEQMWLLFDKRPPRRPTESELVEIAESFSHASTHLD